jgi:hypothetical protein
VTAIASLDYMSMAGRGYGTEDGSSRRAEPGHHGCQFVGTTAPHDLAELRAAFRYAVADDPERLRMASPDALREWQSGRLRPDATGDPIALHDVSAWVGSVNSWCTMLSPDERQVLRQIERSLQSSDPDLARSLERLAPVRPQLSLRWMLFLTTISAMLLGVAGVTLSNLTIGLVGITVSTATCSAYVVVLIRDRMRRHLPP